MQGDLIVVFGGSGFVGRHVVRALAKAGKRVRVAMRRPHLGHELRVLGDVGQVQLMQANVRFPGSVEAALDGASGVVNLVGVINEGGKQNFRALHVDAAETVAKAAAERGIKRLIHMSALGAGPKGARYARTKFAGEEAVRAALPSATILRPSIIFGPGDSFFNRFANLAKFAPVMPLFSSGKTKMQPVFIGDVAEAVLKALDNPAAQGRTYELGGPRVYTFKQLIQFTLNEIQRPRPLIGMPFIFAHPIALLINWGFKLLPFQTPITGDQVTMLRRDNSVSAGALTLADLGVTQLESIEAIAPTYLWRFRPYGQFQTRQKPT